MSAATEDPADRSDGSSSPFSQLVAECLDRIEKEGPEALEEICAQQPDAAVELRKVFASLDAWKREADAEADDAPPPMPEALGGFRLLRRLGGGGMGVVYLAREEALGREVALKLIRPEALYFPGAHERFRREIEILVELHHPGVVPILSVGEDLGLPYFAMELVRGATLAELLRALTEARPERLSGADLRAALDRKIGGAIAEPLGARARALFEGRWTECCARIVREAAETLDFVHRQRVLHRDVKPSNLMLAAHGQVLLLDFGLSSRQGAGELTRTGSQLGSLPYMPPELLRGGSRSLDERGDVYSLGVTLYEMLAFDSPFAGDTAEATRRRILEARPRPLRARNPAVSADLETICLAAMEPDPARRYASSRALAEDLDRWLAHLPIQAHRPGAALRMRRWIQRHPTASVALAMSSLLCICGLLVAVLSFAKDLERERTQLAKDLERGRAEAAALDLERERTREAVSRLLVRTSEMTLEGVPQVERVRRDLLADALDCLRSIVSAPRSTPRDRRELALAQGKLGDAERRIGNLDAARAALEDSLRLQEELARSAPEDEAIRLDVAVGCTHLAQLLLDLGEEERASALLERAAESERLLVAARAEPFRRSKLATTLQQLATLAFSRGEHARAEELYEEAHALREQLAKEAPEDLNAAVELAETRNLRGVRMGQAREHAAALAELAQARAGIEGLSELLRAQPRARWMLVQITSNEGLVLVGARDLSAAHEKFDRAEGILAQLVAELPLVPSYRENLAQVYGHQAILLRNENRLEAAFERQQKSVAELERLSSECVERVDLRSELGASLHGLGLIHRRQAQPAAARTCLERAIELQEVAFRAAPLRTQFRRFLRNHLRAASEVTLELQDLAAAARYAERLAEVMPESPEDALRAAVVLASCAHGEGAGSNGDAERYRARALALLAEADARGLADLAAVESEAAFDDLRSDPVYERCRRAIEARAIRKNSSR